MAKKPTVTTITSGYASNTQLNANFVALRDGFDNTLSLDGSTPNSMGASLDMGGNSLLNGGVVNATDIVVGGTSVATQVTAAATSASNSATSASDSATSASNAATSESNAATSASNAATSESNAATSASDAAASAVSVLDTLLVFTGAWLTSTAYAVNDLVTESGSTYICVVAHTSGTFATDLSTIKWKIFAQKGVAGAGAGDLISSNNLSDLANTTTARTNLGLGVSDSPVFNGLTLDGNSFTNNVITGTNPTLMFSDTGTNDDWRIRNGDGAFIFENGLDGAPTTDRMRIDLNGDVRLYDDTGVAKFFWDASLESLGLGTTTPSEKLSVVGNISVTGTVDGRDITADGVTLDDLDAQYDSSRVLYQITPVVPERAGPPDPTGNSGPTWFPSTGAPYLNTIIAADGPSDTDIVWRSVLLGDSCGSTVARMSQSVAVGNGAMRFSGYSDATTAVGSLSMQWLGLKLEAGEDISDALLRTVHDFVWDRDGVLEINIGKRLDDVTWDKYNLESTLPGTRAKLAAVVIPVDQDVLTGNTAVGRNSGLHIVKGYDNTLVGRNALAHGFDSTENVAIGTRALRNGALANQNVAVGSAAGQNFIEGSDNLFVGDHAGFNITTGSNNLMLGSWAGDGLTGAVDNNLFIGMGTGATPLMSGNFSAGRVGINVDYVEHLGQGLHVRAGTAATGAVPNSASDALVVEQSGASTGMSILTDNTEVGQINFADPEDNNDGYVRYSHSTRKLSLGAANAERMALTSTGVGIGTSSPSSSAILDIQSTTQGVRFPNMTTSQKEAMANVAGVMVFDTTLSKMCFNTGAGWQTITSS